jgi:8-oxo-dGTP pyrophosphatase MutT (NUDIX family)
MAWKRKAARVVLLDDAGRVYLQHASDPMDPFKDPWLELPGGGIHPGESSADAAVRELYEETGIREVKVGPCVWVRNTQFRFGGWDFDQDEWIHVAWVPASAVGEWKPVALEALEAAAFIGARFWTIDELESSSIQTWPSRLREHLPALVDGQLPEDPIDVGH